MISEAVEDELCEYLGSVCKILDCQAIKIGGTDDHVHVLCRLSKYVVLGKLLEKIKSHSSKWIKTACPDLQHFYWQDGYGAFSVNPAQVDHVIEYISNQRVHHQKKTLQDEYRGFLKKYKIDYDERYVWD